MNKINNTVFAVTLKSLRENQACFEGYNRLVRYLQGREFYEQDKFRGSYIRFRHDDMIPIEYILNSNGLGDALWALRCVKNADRDMRLFAVWCARQVQHLMQDDRSINALDVSERFANGYASESELSAARDAAWDAVRDAARGAVRGAAWAAVKVAAKAAASDAAKAAAWAAAWDATMAATWDAKKGMLIKMCRGDAPWQVI